MMTKCPLCDKHFLEWKIRKEFLICSNCRTIVKKEVPKSSSEKNYSTQSVRSLNNDKKHYEKLKETLNKRDFTFVNYQKVFAFGGGFPKLESFIIDTSSIVVFDLSATEYEGNINKFSEVFDYIDELQFVSVDLLDSSISEYIFSNITPDGTYLFTFVHFLEHLSFEDILEVLKCCSYYNNYGNIDVLIYGPNVDMAKDENWYHLKDVNHITFVRSDTFVNILRQYGFENILTTQYSDDLLVYAREFLNSTNL